MAKCTEANVAAKNVAAKTAIIAVIGVEAWSDHRDFWEQEALSLAQSEGYAFKLNPSAHDDTVKALRGYRQLADEPTPTLRRRFDELATELRERLLKTRDHPWDYEDLMRAVSDIEGYIGILEGR